MSPFRVPKGLEVFFHQWLTVASWDFDDENSVDRAVYCRRTTGFVFRKTYTKVVLRKTYI